MFIVVILKTFNITHKNITKTKLIVSEVEVLKTFNTSPVDTETSFILNFNNYGKN